MWQLVAVVAMGAAVLLAPEALEETGEALAPPEAMTRAAALGRTFAASDVIWLRTVQMMGDSESERRRWPGLEDWVDLTTRLDPSFDSPYVYGAMLLVSDPTRAASADRILERGQQALPDQFSFPMMRGFIAYFSRMDPAAAAHHYRQAASLPNAPRYLENFAKRLETQASTCTEMLGNLNRLAAEETIEKRRALLAGRESIVIACVEGQLRNAAGAFRNANARDGSLEELRAAGLVTDELFAPPGMCWVVRQGRPSLLECPAQEGPP